MKIMLVVSSKVKLIKNNHGYSIKIQTSFEKNTWFSSARKCLNNYSEAKLN